MPHPSDPVTRPRSRSRSRSPRRSHTEKHHRTRSPSSPSSHKRHHHRHHHTHSRQHGSHHDSSHSRPHDHDHTHRHKRRRTTPAPVHTNNTTNTTNPTSDTQSYIPSTAVPPRPLTLPFAASPLSNSSRDLRHYRPLLASYLDIAKNRFLEEMEEEEVKGRWRSFVGRWNAGRLAEGWYDPSVLERARAAAEVEEVVDGVDGNGVVGDVKRAQRETMAQAEEGEEAQDRDEEEEEDDDDVGPAPPPPTSISTSTSKQTSKHGPTIPTLPDLQLRDEDLASQRASEISTQRLSRKADQALQKERTEEMAPRAAAGTRERRVEKRREVASGNAAFAYQKGQGDGMAEVGEGELLGDGDGDGGGVKEMRAREERKKNEREVRREEVLRARVAEREERMRGMREKEERTMSMLRGLAGERFGGGGGVE